MMMSLKAGVKIAGVRPEMIAAWPVVSDIYNDHGYDCVVTSVCDSKHGRGSFHYNGLATDFRTTTIDPRYDWANVSGDIRRALTDEYDVVLEADHIHVEFQPKNLA